MDKLWVMGILYYLLGLLPLSLCHPYFTLFMQTRYGPFIDYKLNTPFFARESSIRYTFGALELLLSCVSPLKNLKVGCLMFLGVIWSFIFLWGSCHICIVQVNALSLLGVLSCFFKPSNPEDFLPHFEPKNNSLLCDYLIFLQRTWSWEVHARLCLPVVSLQSQIL